MRKKLSKLALNLLFALFCATLSNAADAKELLIVAAKAKGNVTLDTTSVVDAFLGKPARFSNGYPVMAIDRRESQSGIRDSFYENVIGKSTTQMKAYWSQQIFTGKGYPPQVADDLDQLKKILQARNGAISYLEQSELTSDFVVLLKVDAN